MSEIQYLSFLHYFPLSLPFALLLVMPSDILAFRHLQIAKKSFFGKKNLGRFGRHWQYLLPVRQFTVPFPNRGSRPEWLPGTHWQSPCYRYGLFFTLRFFIMYLFWNARGGGVLARVVLAPRAERALKEKRVEWRLDKSETHRQEWLLPLHEHFIWKTLYD